MAGATPPPKNEPQDFEIIRTQRVEEPSPMLPVAIGVVLVIAIVTGAYFVLQGGEPAEPRDGEVAETPAGGGDAPTASEPVPDYVWGRINFLEDQGYLEKALTEAEEALEEYPNSTEMRARVEFYRRELGYEEEVLGAEDVEQRIADARVLIQEGRYDEALARLDQALDADPESAEGWFLHGQAMGLSGDRLEALSDLEEARRLGYDSAKVDALVQRFQ